MRWKECKLMDELLKFIARLLEGEQMAPLCGEFGQISAERYLTKRCLQRRHQYQIAQERAGRIILLLAVGLGAYREEFEAWGPAYKKARRGDMLDEGIDAFLKLISERSASLDGEYYHFTDVEMYPKPKQDPFPLFIGGHNIPALKRAAAVGQG